MIRKNINRGFTKLRVWQDAMELFKLIYNITKNLPYEINKIRNNILDAANSIIRNISEGYCRKNLREYLNFLNISLGSCGELNAAMISLKEINVINEKDFEKFDVLHYKVENELIKFDKIVTRKTNEKRMGGQFC
ncbi:MAG: four helix bundle protein [Melioribacter sp.]|nr:four helix bundle protein [Melioribacter sp.]